MYGPLSDETTGLSFTIAAYSRQHSHSRVWVLLTHDHILLYQISDLSNLEGQIPYEQSDLILPP
jgi:hypothetical protein